MNRATERDRDRAPAVRQHRLPVLLAVFLFALAAAPAAMADSTQSSNWAGYAVHRSHVSFKRVFGAWRQPSATCESGTSSYSSDWVGIGGYSESSDALEQIGSEVDCNPHGRVVSSVWYELVPAASQTIRMRVNPGDYLTAAVSIKGHQVHLQLNDLTRHTSFSRTLHANALDRSSAEWIVEAPSVCQGNSCQILSLADFGSATFTRADALSGSGHKGAIDDHHWSTTKITLATTGVHFINNPGSTGPVSALPSPLYAHSSAFTVTYSEQGQTEAAAAKSERPRTLLASRLTRPARRP